jgi:hypothetical protein
LLLRKQEFLKKGFKLSLTYPRIMQQYWRGFMLTYILESEIGPKETPDYQALELQVSVKSKEHATLQVSTCLRKKR